MDSYFTITITRGDEQRILPVRKRRLGDYTWYEIDTGVMITSVAKLKGAWQLTGPKSDLTIEDIQAFGERMDEQESPA